MAHGYSKIRVRWGAVSSADPTAGLRGLPFQALHITLNTLARIPRGSCMCAVIPTRGPDATPAASGPPTARLPGRPWEGSRCRPQLQLQTSSLSLRSRSDDARLRLRKRGRCPAEDRQCPPELRLAWSTKCSVRCATADGISALLSGFSTIAVGCLRQGVGGWSKRRAQLTTRNACDALPR